jgi:signal transduction histidine kinase
MKRAAYPAILALAFVIGIAVSWTFGTQIDNNAYDFIFTLRQPKLPPKPWTPSSIILAVDDASFQALGGLVGMRKAFAAALTEIRAAGASAVAFDVTFSDTGEGDDALEAAFRATPNLILPCVLQDDGEHWSDPLPRFSRWAAALGQVHAQLDKYDAVSREIPLEKATSRARRFALALEAYRVSRHAEIIESPADLTVGGVTIPASWSEGRRMLIRYRPIGSIPRVSLKELADDPSKARLFHDKVVFAGVTDQTAVQDRRMTPLSNQQQMPGIEIHANAFETIAQHLFLTRTAPSTVLLVCLLFVTAAGATFAWLQGWLSYLAAAVIIVIAHVLPYALFRADIVFPYTPGVITAWLAIVSAAAWQHLVVRRRLATSESARERYQEAMQFVTHEMKTPLTAIQGSSELIGRYVMTDEKRKQMAGVINSESKRLAQMIETFLSVERLSAGQIELKREPFTAADLLEKCIGRVRPIADRKSIEIETEHLPSETLMGDRELMEYAFYNLLNNAVKYSPAKTRVTVFGEREKDQIRVTVQDQGIGIAPKDARKIFEKFYRTENAERSGEKGTGIGLSIVQQIVNQHGGSIAVSSELGKGSRFTISLPCGTGFSLSGPRAG